MRTVAIVRNTIFTILTAVALIVFGYTYRNRLYPIITPIVEKVQIILGTTPACSQPIPYSIGAFDSRFGVSKSQFLLDIADAAAIWNTAANKPLLKYSDNGNLKINFIYDYRQQATAQMQNLGITIKDDTSSYNALKAKYDSLMVSYTQSKAALDTLYANYTAAKNDYEQKVSYWNDQGGVPRDQYASLEQERLHVNDLANQVNAAQSSLNTLILDVNSAATVMNRLASILNLNVNNYNTIGQSTGEEFDEGEYIRDVNGTRIDIYQYDSQDKLIRVLAHELGHALGLQHVDDSKAIMYKLNQSSNETPTAADIDELKSVCGIK